MDESGTDEEECGRKVASGSRVAGAIRSLVNTNYLPLECAQIFLVPFLGTFLETFLVHVLIYVSETMLWKEKERSGARAVQMDNLRGLLGMRKME